MVRSPPFVILMTDEQQKEQFQTAYVHAVASVAHFEVDVPPIDRNCVDLRIISAGEHQTKEEVSLCIQLKATEQDFMRSDGIHFPLEVDHYNHLRKTEVYSPRILVVMLLPADVGQWINQSAEQIILRHCCYWKSLAGMEETTNTSTVTVTLPKENIFTPDKLIELMQRVSNNDLPL